MVGVGSFVGIIAGPSGWFGDYWYWFGSQGWEYLEMGRAFQYLWMVIHMWVEAFFEVLTTILVGWVLVLMGLVKRPMAERAVYLSAVLFLGSGLLGISHNSYWNAKPTGSLALGAVFSSLQVVPLLLLTLDAW